MCTVVYLHPNGGELHNMALSQEMNEPVKNRPLPKRLLSSTLPGKSVPVGVMLGMMMRPDEKVILAKITFFKDPKD